jgi:hypothetical protein
VRGRARKDCPKNLSNSSNSFELRARSHSPFHERLPKVKSGQSRYLGEHIRKHGIDCCAVRLTPGDRLCQEQEEGPRLRNDRRANRAIRDPWIRNREASRLPLLANRVAADDDEEYEPVWPSGPRATSQGWQEVSTSITRALHRGSGGGAGNEEKR